MNISSRRTRRHPEPARAQAARRRRRSIALLLPAVVVVSTVLSGPAYADDADNTPSDTSTETSQQAPADDATQQAEPKQDAPSDPPAEKPTKEEPAPPADSGPDESEEKPDPKPEAPTDQDKKADDQAGKKADDKAPEAESPAKTEPEKVVNQPVQNTFTAAAAKDDEEDAKVVVCKYTSTPPGGADHIIVRSVNAIPGFPAAPTFPWSSNDAQDSIAIRFAVGNEQPADTPEVIAANCPVRLLVPTPPVIVNCGPNNDVYGVIDISPAGAFTVLRSLDRSVTLVADYPRFVFFPAQVTVVLPAPVDANTACPAEIAPPDLDVIDECGTGNAHYEAVPASPDYTADAPLADGSILLHAVAPATFPGGATTYQYPAVVETNKTACPKKVVVCKWVTTPQGLVHHVIVVSVNAADPTSIGKTWDQVVDSDFPIPFNDAQASVAIRFAVGNEQPGDEILENGGCPVDLDVPEVPQTDPCNPPGVTSNVAFGALPPSDGKWTADTSVAGQITFTATGINYFELEVVDGNVTYVKTAVVKLGADSGVKCLVAPAITANDPCNPVGVTSNATWVIPVETPDYTVSVVNGVIQLIAKLGKVFEGDKPTFTYALAVSPPDSGVVCQVAGVQETKNPPKKQDEVKNAAVSGLPNTGGPAGWLMPLGVGLVLAGAGLVLGRRDRTA
ncbi:hypothetical protein FHP29_20180 [Nocardioides albidus]|uniref:LPXTG cell wall anchor domain-containing protein n=1 Tax=Nocardioides albidus TaxID=1517589 RepID=A0A5C4VMM0_9ACTN|nr:hypothetical protein [Nocardioides albidus]TNM36459.1 hypothetical protein FHP29_20180 [Nocardioides albidus]